MRNVAFLGILVLATTLGCDPDLTPVRTTAPTDPGKEGGAAPPASESPDGDGGTEPEPGVDAGSDEDVQTVVTHKIDGVDDFAAGEKFITSSAGYAGYVAWDAKNLYFGMSGGDVGKAASEKRWILVYIEGAGGTTTAVNYNDGGAGSGQQPNLPFSAKYHLGFKSDLSYTNKLIWDSAQSKWVDAGIGLVPVAAYKTTFMEGSISRAQIGNPPTVKIHMSMINEKASGQWTFAGVPESSFEDGVDPDYSKYFEFNLADGSKAPSSYTPLPQ